MTEIDLTTGARAEELREQIAREVDPRLFDASRWYPGPEQGYSRSQMFARIDMTLNSKAFAEHVAATRRAGMEEAAAIAKKYVWGNLIAAEIRAAIDPKEQS
jgi:hypothetical protein